MSEYHEVVGKIRALLDDASVSYTTFAHEAVRTSKEAAAIRPEYTIAQGAKALIVRIKRKGVPKDQEKRFVQIVLPGDAKFDVKKSRDVLHAKDIRFATEDEVAEITGGVQPGGVPPFGILFGIPVFVDKTLLKNDEIIFNAGDRRFSIAMKSEDYIAIVNPHIVSIV